MQSPVAAPSVSLVRRLSRLGALVIALGLAAVAGVLAWVALASMMEPVVAEAVPRLAVAVLPALLLPLELGRRFTRRRRGQGSSVVHLAKLFCLAAMVQGTIVAGVILGAGKQPTDLLRTARHAVWAAAGVDSRVDYYLGMFVPGANRELYLEKRTLADAQPAVATYLALADWCGARNLTAERQEALARVLALDPAHKEARLRLAGGDVPATAASNAAVDGGQAAPVAAASQPAPARPQQAAEIRRTPAPATAATPVPTRRRPAGGVSRVSTAGEPAPVSADLPRENGRTSAAGPGDAELSRKEQQRLEQAYRDVEGRIRQWQSDAKYRRSYKLTDLYAQGTQLAADLELQIQYFAREGELGRRYVAPLQSELGDLRSRLSVLAARLGLAPP